MNLLLNSDIVNLMLKPKGGGGGTKAKFCNFCKLECFVCG